MKLLTPFNCNGVHPGTTCEKLEAQSPHSKDRAPGGGLSAWPPPSSSSLHLFLSLLLPCTLVPLFFSNFYRNLSLLSHSVASSGISLMAKLQPLPPSPPGRLPVWLSADHLSEHWHRTALFQVAEDGEGKALGSPGTLFQSPVGYFTTT